MSKYAYEKKNVILDIDKICLTLGGNEILRDVSVQIQDIVRPDTTQGQIVGFLGPSGVGKTKLFEIMAGLLQPTSGTVRLGSPLEHVRVGRVGVVQQNYPLFQHRTILGNLLVGLESNPGVPESKRRARALELLEKFGLSSKRDAYPAQLSGGQRQRIAIAQQLACSGRFLLLDEPFSGLDPNMVDEVSRMLVEVANLDELNTIVIVSHDIASTAAIADTLWVMGRDRTPKGDIVPGAYIKHVYDLMERELCWREDAKESPRFLELIHEVRGLFKDL